MSEYILLKSSGPSIYPRADLVTHTMQVIDYAHHETHAGSAYLVIYSVLAGDTDVIEVRIQTPNSTKWAHMLMSVDSSLAATAEIIEGTTKTHVGGNALVGLNRNRNSTNTSGLTICHTPAGAADTGTPIITQYLGAATVAGKGNSGGNAGGREELILDQNNDYLIRVTSRADANAMTITLDWYEHTNKV
jgi:hypothetical protein